MACFFDGCLFKESYTQRLLGSGAMETMVEVTQRRSPLQRFF